MFAQIIRGKTASDPKAIDGTFNRWSNELAPGAKGWLGIGPGLILFRTVAVRLAQPPRSRTAP